MAYKSNKQARAEYLQNKQRNREINRKAYERRKERGGNNGFLRILLLGSLVLIVLSILKH